MCIQFVRVFWTLACTVTLFWGKYITMSLAGESVRFSLKISSLGWLLLMTRMKDGGILRVCEQRDSSLHHFMMDKFPPSSRHALVVTVMTSGFLLLFWRAVGCDSHTVRYQHVSHCSPSPLLILFHVLYYPPPPSSNDKLLTYCPFYQSHPKRSTTSETMNYISFSPLSLSCPVWCFRNNSSIENSTSSDKSYYNTMQHNNRGQPALNSRWVLPVPGRKWHWAPLLSYFILAENRDYHHFIFCKSIPHRVWYKFISVFLSSFSAWIPVGLLSSLARNTGCTKSSILPQNSSPPLLWRLSGWNRHDSIAADRTQMCTNAWRVCSCAEKYT